MNNLIYIVIALALVGFLWGVLKFLFSKDSQKLKKEGKEFMLYGIITLFVMTSLGGLVYMLQSFISSTNYSKINIETDSIQYEEDAGGGNFNGVNYSEDSGGGNFNYDGLFDTN